MTHAHELLKEILANLDDPHSDPIRTDGLMERIREYLAESKGNEYGISDKDRSRLFYGFLLDCNYVGPESAGVNLARGIKALLKNHGGEE